MSTKPESMEDCASLWHFYVDGVEVPREKITCQAMNFGQTPRAALVPQVVSVRNFDARALAIPFKVLDQYLDENKQYGVENAEDEIWFRLGCPAAAELSVMDPDLLCTLLRDLAPDLLDALAPPTSSRNAVEWIINRIDSVTFVDGILTLNGLAYRAGGTCP